jgi:hypothetical protein
VPVDAPRLEDRAGPEILPVEDPRSLRRKDSLQVLCRALCLTGVAEEYVEASIDFAPPWAEALLEVRTRRATASVSRRRLQRLVGPTRRSQPPPCRSLPYALRRERHQRRRLGWVLALQRRHYSCHVVAVFTGNRCPMLPHLFHDGISASHGVGSISSSGVQITGGTNPATRTASSILPRKTAFARCRRFQVNR